MIKFRHKGIFGARSALIETPSFICAVSTAKEGFTKGLSTIIIAGGYHGTPCGKLIYSPSLKKSDRQQLHEFIVQEINSLGEKGCGLRNAIQIVINKLKEGGMIIEGINTIIEDEEYNEEVGDTDSDESTENLEKKMII